MTFKPRNFIFFFLFFASFPCFSQNIPAPGEDAYEPDSLFAVRNALKVDPIQIVFGEYNLSYERIINAGFSLELSGGITRRNYAAGWFEYTLDNLGQNVEINTGYTFSFFIRKYLINSSELYGPYFAAGFGSKKYYTDYHVIDSSGTLTDISFEDQRQMNSYMFNFGYQALPPESNIFADFYIGISYQQKDYSIVKADNIYDPDTYYISNDITHSIGMQAGVKIGVGF